MDLNEDPYMYTYNHWLWQVERGKERESELRAKIAGHSRLLQEQNEKFTTLETKLDEAESKVQEMSKAQAQAQVGHWHKYSPTAGWEHPNLAHYFHIKTGFREALASFQPLNSNAGRAHSSVVPYVC